MFDNAKLDVLLVNGEVPYYGGHEEFSLAFDCSKQAIDLATDTITKVVLENSELFDGDKPLDSLRLTVKDENIRFPIMLGLNFHNLSLSEQKFNQLRDAIGESLTELCKGTTRQLYTELSWAREAEKPSSQIKSEFRRLIREYGMDEFARALKQFESEPVK